MLTLGIDYGAKYIGIALVRNTKEGNEPLFAGVLIRPERDFKDKTQPRAAIRRLRRTRKTKKARLRTLESRLISLGLDEGTTSHLIRFCGRRGYKPLQRGEIKEESDTEELTYEVNRENFFRSLQAELDRLVPAPELRAACLAECEHVLNRHGDPALEIRPMRIDNRGVSRCAWEGCSNVTPRRVNAMEDAIKQVLVNFFQASLKEDDKRLEQVLAVTDELSRISPKLRRSVAEEDKDRSKALRKRARTLLRQLQEDLRSDDDTDVDAERSWKYVEQGVMNIIEKSEGRNTYCREHSEAYVGLVVEGKQLPFKKTISESDIVSRREQITFAKVWRYIEARLLPLAPEGIDSLVVERTAFDLLRGSRKSITAASPKRIEEIYQAGPMLNFKSRSEMLRQEFGGLCAYCGKASDRLLESEHIMPRKEFFFDGYLNLLPSCPSCNRGKAARRIGGGGLTIHPAAYDKYCKYLSDTAKKRPLHALHTEKKGLLNLMKDPERSWETDRYLSLIANSLASVTRTQRGPRPLARYLYSKLSASTKKSPKIEFRNGRHTALYAAVAYPAFDKAAEKEAGGMINHALDAVLLASTMPAPSRLEGRGINARMIGSWVRSVRDRAPKPGTEGVPVVPVHQWCVPEFENVDACGYVTIDLGAMNWNKKDTAGHKQDPFGWSEKKKMPTKRIGAQDLFEKLTKEKDAKKVKGQVDRIHHPALRKTMKNVLEAEAPGPAAAAAMKEWLRESVANSIDTSTFSNHPADQERKRELQEFAVDPDKAIPTVIGVKRYDTGVRGKIDMERPDPVTGLPLHRYQTDPSNRAAVLAYPRNKQGTCDNAKPRVAFVRQNYKLKTENKEFKPKPTLLEIGRPWGDSNFYIHDWARLLEHYLAECGFHSYAMLTSGCVVRYADGTESFIRNFDKATFRESGLKYVTGVRRNPFVRAVTPLKELTPHERRGNE